MNKNLYLIIIALLGLSFASCKDTSTQIDQTWKSANESAFNNLKSYYELQSQSGQGSVKWIHSNVLTDDTIAGVQLRATYGINPIYTDTVSVRYIGWYLDSYNNNKKIIFDQTEGSNNKVPRSLVVGQTIDGWQTVLQDMEVGEEREVCIPWILGYGSMATAAIPAYTTLYFNLKLLKITHQK